MNDFLNENGLIRLWEHITYLVGRKADKTYVDEAIAGLEQGGPVNTEDLVQDEGSFLILDCNE